MSTRKYESGYSKLQKRLKREASDRAQAGSMHNYVVITKKDKPENIGERPSNDKNNFSNITDNEVIMEEVSNNQENHVDPKVHAQEEQTDELPNSNPKNIFDPSQWTSIDNKLRELLVETGPTKIYNMDFPKDESLRHFSSTLYIQHLANGEKHERRWLVYSVELDRVFCFCCKLFNTAPCKSKLAKEGSNDWRNIGAKLKKHETSTEHITNMSAWFDLETRLKKDKTIDKDLQERINKDKEHWKNVLIRLIALIKALGKRTLAFRGKKETLYEEDNGNYLTFVEMMAEFDPVMQEHIRRIKNNEIHNHYLGHNIQNELISLLGCTIKTEIVKIIRDAKYFSIILDCTPDISHTEQMSIIIRCLDISSSSTIKVVEYFLGFLEVDDTSGKGLFDAIVDEIKNIGLDFDDIRGQGYDNGSNMKGKNLGVQKRFLDINPRAFYTPCGCHSLNLVICDMANSCSKASEFFGVVQSIYTLFSSSPKRWKILQDHIHNLTLKPLSQTRWESRIESVKAIRYQAPQIRDALYALNKVCSDPKAKRDSKTLAKHELAKIYNQKIFVLMMLLNN
ncbi:zinc finger MYM-type protein 1-like protein [Tanacetum coccineum]